jgi:hypothetical protein
MSKNGERDIQSAKYQLDNLLDSISDLNYNQISSGGSKNSLGYICCAPKCKNRLISDKCMINDTNHIDNHSSYIKTIHEFKSSVVS